ncbi:hypothetical protein [Sphingomonas sp.]|uniref:hypothetical protein n=1 Tax=Sphingomonas sp. TaxID=28214 RepID=UPI001ED26579|nr:hypothetical protein [Sphingomonas sp.]MBX3594214.1 hypothetical protein [Sphingomonas sp.]
MTVKIWIAVAITALASGCGDGGPAGEGGGTVAMTRDGKVGAEFGSAGPRICADKKSPASGAPSAAQAAAYSICALEGQFSDALFLVDNVVVTDIGKPRKHDPTSDVNFAEMDTSRPIYDIRGNFDSYQCRYLSTTKTIDMGPKYRKGSNCIKRRSANAKGACYVDTFGDWRCTMVDVDARDIIDDEAPPPA